MISNLINAIEFNELTLGYRDSLAVTEFSGAIKLGSLTAVVGANGSGKSTIFKGIIGALKPISGNILFASHQEIAYLPQRSELDLSFPARVFDFVSLGLWSKRGLLGRITSSDRQCIANAIEKVGLSEVLHKTIDNLSGGQMQRAMFARVIVQDANIILLDEPFNAIDANTTIDLIDQVKAWHNEKRTIMVIMHDLNLVRKYFPNMILMAQKPLAWGETSKLLTSQIPMAARCSQSSEEMESACEVNNYVAFQSIHRQYCKGKNDVSTL
ncbi:MAG: ABC transporter [Hyphomicrobiales bacterium]|nr:MAG: ABC transporter [Hyphomicrobiales bacterium]